MDFLITGARFWDGSSEAYAPRGTELLVEEGQITGFGPALDSQQVGRVLDLSGLTILPGLIDAHIHLCLNSKLSGRAAEDPERAGNRATSMLSAGITTARDLGGEDNTALALRDRIRSGRQHGPRLLCAGQPLTVPGGHCHFWGGVVESADDIKRAVSSLAQARVDWIKVMATGGVLTQGTNPSKSQFGLDKLQLVVRTAESFGLPVAAHCHGTEAMADCARAGVRSIEHASFAGRGGFGTDFRKEVCELIAKANSWVAPTVNAGWHRFLDDPGQSEFVSRMQACFKGLIEAGVMLVASTDAGIPRSHHDSLPSALPILAEFTGLSPLNVLKTATSDAADALGLEDITGRLRVGLSADIMAVAGDPLTDLMSLSSPHWVFSRGIIVRSPDQKSPSASQK